MSKYNSLIQKLKLSLNAQSNLELAVLVGSQAEDKARKNSDWDIAIQWKRELNLLENLACTETLRRELANVLRINEHLVDLINIPSAGITMRENIAQHGIPLMGQNSLAWNHFLGRVWRELEMLEWEKQHAS